MKPILGEPSGQRMPSGEAIRKAAIAMERTDKGLCPDCVRPVNEDGECDACNPKEVA